MNCCLLNQIVAGSVTDTNPPEPPVDLGLVLIFTDFSALPVSDVNDVDEWNTVLVEGGGQFTSVVVNEDTFTVTLIGANQTELFAQVFENSATILSIEDQTDEIVSIGFAFAKNAVFLSSVILNGLSNLQNETFYGCEQLLTVEMDGITILGDSVFYNNLSLTGIDFPLCTAIGALSFNNTPQLVDANLPMCVTLGDDCFDSSNLSGTIDFTAVETIGNECFTNCQFTTIVMDLLTLANGGNNFSGSTTLVSVSFPQLTAIGDAVFQNCTALTTVSCPVATVCGVTPGFANVFGGCVSLTTVDLSSCTDLGGSEGDDIVFDGISGNTITITVPVSLETIDGGNPDGDLVYLAANNTATINYI